MLFIFSIGTIRLSANYMIHEIKLYTEKLAQSFIAVWGSMILSAYFLFMLLHHPIPLWSIMVGLCFFVGLAALAFAIKNTLKWRRFVLDYTGEDCGASRFLAGFIVLAANNILSLTSSFGGSFYPLIESTGFASYLTLTTIIALLAFFAFPILTYLGCLKARSILPGMNYVIPYALTLLIISFVFSPIILFIINKGGGGGFFNFLAVILYIPSIYLFYKSWDKSLDPSKLLRKEEITPITEEEKPRLTAAGKSMGIAYAAIWFITFLSATGLFLMLREGSGFGRVLFSACWWLAYPVIGYAVYVASKLKKILINRPNNGTNLLYWAIILLFGSNTISLSSIFGGVPVLEGIFEFLSIVAVLIYTVSAVMTFLGMTKLQAILPSLKTSCNASLALMIATIVLSPLILNSVNAFFEGSPTALNIIAGLAYGVSALCFIIPWFNCTKETFEKPIEFFFTIDPENNEVVYPEKHQEVVDGSLEQDSNESMPREQSSDTEEEEKAYLRAFKKVKESILNTSLLNKKDSFASEDKPTEEEWKEEKEKNIFLTYWKPIAVAVCTILLVIELMWLFGVFSSDENDNSDSQVVVTKIIQADQSDENDRLEALRKDSLLRDSLHKDSLKKVAQKKAEEEKQQPVLPLPTLSTFIQFQDGQPYDIIEVEKVRNNLVRLGFKKINNSKYILNEGTPQNLSVTIDYRTWDGEYDPEYDDYIGGGMSYSITLQFANREDAQRFCQGFENQSYGWVQISANGNKIKLETYGD